MDNNVPNIAFNKQMRGYITLFIIGNLYSMKHFFRKLSLNIVSVFQHKVYSASRKEIDIVIPIIRKDLDILPLCLKGIRRCVTNTINSIYIVAPNDPEIVRFSEKEHLHFVEESSVLGFSPSDMDLFIAKQDGSLSNRSGWLFQQLIKLSGNVGTCENYLCVDSDHVLIRPHTFLADDGCPVFYMSSELHKPYYDNIKLLLGCNQFHPFSFVAHKMLFNKKQLRLLHNVLENRSGKNWVSAIVDSYDRCQISGFSEFELYGNFCKKKHTIPWNQLALKYCKLNTYDALVEKYSRKFSSITFPSWLSSK